MFLEQLYNFIVISRRYSPFIDKLLLLTHVAYKLEARLVKRDSILLPADVVDDHVNGLWGDVALRDKRGQLEGKGEQGRKKNYRGISEVDECRLHTWQYLTGENPPGIPRPFQCKCVQNECK
jgi:hypothetical protein